MPDAIQDMIYEIRGHKVMLDSDLARLYEIETKALNRAVKRNIEEAPAALSLRLIPIWVETAIRLEREIMGLTPGKSGKPEPVHFKIVFTQDFEGL